MNLVTIKTDKIIKLCQIFMEFCCGSLSHFDAKGFGGGGGVSSLKVRVLKGDNPIKPTVEVM